MRSKSFRPRIRSRHPSHSCLRGVLPLFMKRVVIRLGSTTEMPADYVEINKVEAVKNSANKRRMKDCFSSKNVKTARWTSNIDEVSFFPVVAKHIYGSRGEGNYLLKTKEELSAWRTGKTLNNYIFEEYLPYKKEYRLHVTKDGCFYTCRKALKKDTPEDKKWFRNDSNSVWIIESNPEFKKPDNWQKIIEESVKALNAVGLDIGAVDLRVQDKKEPDFFIVEINSAPSFGEITEKKYKEELTKLIAQKI